MKTIATSLILAFSLLSFASLACADDGLSTTDALAALIAGAGRDYVGVYDADGKPTYENLSLILSGILASKIKVAAGQSVKLVNVESECQLTAGRPKGAHSYYCTLILGNGSYTKTANGYSNLTGESSIILQFTVFLNEGGVAVLPDGKVVKSTAG